MTRMIAIGALLVATVGAGCTYNPSFDRRASYDTLERAEALDAAHKGPIDLEWAPRSFPDRIDTIHPAGQEGAITKATIPTGVALSTRTGELLDAAIGVSPSSDATLTIEVREATTDYWYAPGFIGERHINAARCNLNATFRYGDRSWDDRFVAQASTADTGLKGNDLLDRAWDDVAIAVTENVVANLPDRAVYTPAYEPASTPVVYRPVPTAPAIAPAPAPRPARSLTVPEEVEALRRVLIRKRLISEDEWNAAMAEVISERD